MNIHRLTRILPPYNQTYSLLSLANSLSHTIKLVDAWLAPDQVDKKIDLGHYMCEDIYKFNTSECVSEFTKQGIWYLTKFRYANSHIWNILLDQQCKLFMEVRCLPCLVIVYRRFVHQENSLHTVGVANWLDHTFIPQLAGLWI